MAKSWAKFPYADKKFVYTAATLKKAWERLHKGDCEPFPKDEAVVEAWMAFHAGEFHKAAELVPRPVRRHHGRQQGDQHLRQLPRRERQDQACAVRGSRLARGAAAIRRAEERQRVLLARLRTRPLRAGHQCGQGAGGGIGGKVKASLETAIKLAPKHADAHIALGAYHAEIIDKVGAMVGGLTYGAKKDVGLKHFETALKLNPDSAIARIEMANGLVMLEGKKALARAEALYGEAAACEPADAMEKLDIELAKAELED